MIRWKGIAVFAGIAVLFFIMSFFLTDHWIERQIEDAGSSLIGAKVEIDGFDLELLDMHVSLQHLQVTNPKNTMRNTLETGKIDFDVSFWPLLSGKLIVEKMTVKEIQHDTPRKTDGKIEGSFSKATKGYVGEAASFLKKEGKEYATPAISGLGKQASTDSIFSRLDLKSVAKMDSLEKEIDKKYKKWNDRIKNIDIEKDIAVIRNETRNIDTKKLSDPVKLKKSLDAVNKIRKSVNRLNNTYKEVKNDFSKDYNSASADLKNASAWVADDYKKAMAIANIPDFSVENIGKIIFGNEVMNQYLTYMGYLGTAREYLEPSETTPPKEEAPQRFKGQNIHFTKRYADPDWWIKEVDLSAYWGDILLTGQITDIVSDQKQINKKTILKASGKSEHGAKLTIDAFFNYLDEKPNENIKIEYSGFSLKNRSLSKSAYLPGKVENGVGTIFSETDLKGEDINGLLNFTGSKLSFKSGKERSSQNRYTKMIKDALADIKTVTMTAKISGKSDQLKFDLNSNIDRLVRDALKKALNKEVEKAKADIKKRIDSETKKYRDRLTEKTKKYEKDIRGKLSKYEKQINNELKVVDDKKKDIEKAIAKQTGKVEKKLKDLFKF